MGAGNVGHRIEIPGEIATMSPPAICPTASEARALKSGAWFRASLRSG
jgi:hypothetical protein